MELEDTDEVIDIAQSFTAAVASSDITMAKTLISKYPGITVWCDEEALIQKACQRGSPSMVQLLLADGDGHGRVFNDGMVEGLARGLRENYHQESIHFVTPGESQMTNFQPVVNVLEEKKEMKRVSLKFQDDQLTTKFAKLAHPDRQLQHLEIESTFYWLDPTECNNLFQFAAMNGSHLVSLIVLMIGIDEGQWPVTAMRRLLARTKSLQTIHIKVGGNASSDLEEFLTPKVQKEAKEQILAGMKENQGSISKAIFEPYTNDDDDFHKDIMDIIINNQIDHKYIPSINNRIAHKKSQAEVVKAADELVNFLKEANQDFASIALANNGDISDERVDLYQHSLLFRCIVPLMVHLGIGAYMYTTEDAVDSSVATDDALNDDLDERPAKKIKAN